MRMQLDWLSQTRQDCLFEISRLSKISESADDNNKCGAPSPFITQLNRTINYEKLHDINISFRNLDLESVKITGYSDAIFANNLDLSSHLE